MALTVHKNAGSIFEINEQSRNAINGDVRFNGDSGLLRIGAGCSGVLVNITIGDNCSVVIGPGCNLSCLEIFTLKNSSVSIGHGSGFTWNAQILAHEPYNIDIGSGCIFASGSIITVSDMHSIIDLESKELLNRGGNISIGDKVWVGQDSMILKKVVIGRGVIIGAKSVVSSNIPANTLAAGVPARVIKHAVTWDFSNPEIYENN